MPDTTALDEIGLRRFLESDGIKVMMAMQELMKGDASSLSVCERVHTCKDSLVP